MLSSLNQQVTENILLLKRVIGLVREQDKINTSNMHSINSKNYENKYLLEEVAKQTTC